MSANDLEIERNGADLKITGNAGTLIRFNGQEAATFTIAGVDSLRGYFGAGSDTIHFENGLILNNVTLYTGAGSNDIEFRDVTINGLLTVTGGNNGDKVEFDAATLNGITLNLINGNDEVEFKGSTINGIVSINTGNGSDSVETDIGTGGITNTFVGAVTIKTGNQQDSIELSEATFADLTIDAGADNDEIQLETITVTGRLSLTAGAGNDEITLDGVTQTGVATNAIIGLAGIDEVKLKGSSFASNVAIDMGSGPNNELEIDDCGFQKTLTIVSMGINDEIRIEQDLALSGETDLIGAVSITMGPGGEIGLGANNGASFTQASAAVTIRGSKPTLLATVAQLRVGFATPPVLKNAEFLLV